jgi:hypothetical protein
MPKNEAAKIAYHFPLHQSATPSGHSATGNPLQFFSTSNGLRSRKTPRMVAVAQLTLPLLSMLHLKVRHLKVALRLL